MIDPQCGLLLLREYGLPMATWITRTVDPLLVGPFARIFDERVIDAWKTLVAFEGEITEDVLSCLTLPFREGGCGLRSMEQNSPIAHYASVVGTYQVGLEEVVGRAIATGEHRRLGGALDHQVEGPGWEARGIADVALVETDTCGLKAGDIEFRAAAVEVVEASDSSIRNLFAESQCQIRADESSAPGDQNMHL